MPLCLWWKIFKNKTKCHYVHCKMILLRSYIRCIFPLNVIKLNTSNRTLVLSYFFHNPAQSLFSAIIILGKFFDGQNYWSQGVCWWGGEVVFEVTTNTLIGQFRKYKMCNTLDNSKNFAMQSNFCNPVSIISCFWFFGKVPKNTLRVGGLENQ